MAPELPALLRQVPLREVEWAAFELGSHGVVPAIEPAEERDHGNELDDLLVLVVLAKLGEVGVRRFVGNQGRIASEPQRGALGVAVQVAALELDGRLQLLRGDARALGAV